MKKFANGVFALVMFAAFGCNESTPESSKATASTEKPAQPVTTVKKPVVEKPIASGADKKPVVEKPILGEADNTFSLSLPFESIALAQGEEEAVLIGINKGENFREQVAIKMTELPMGVTLETTDPVIKQGSTEVTLMIKAASDAALGDFTFKVTGHTASSGADFAKEIKLTVSKRGETP